MLGSPSLFSVPGILSFASIPSGGGDGQSSAKGTNRLKAATCPGDKQTGPSQLKGRLPGSPAHRPSSLPYRRPTHQLVLPLRARSAARTVSSNVCARSSVAPVLSFSWPARSWAPVACGYSFPQLRCLWVQCLEHEYGKKGGPGVGGDD